MFKYPDIIIRELILWNLLEQIDTTFVEMYPTVLTAVDLVRI